MGNFGVTDIRVASSLSGIMFAVFMLRYCEYLLPQAFHDDWVLLNTTQYVVVPALGYSLL